MSENPFDRARKVKSIADTAADSFHQSTLEQLDALFADLSMLSSELRGHNVHFGWGKLVHGGKCIVLEQRSHGKQLSALAIQCRGTVFWGHADQIDSSLNYSEASEELGKSRQTTLDAIARSLVVQGRLPLNGWLVESRIAVSNVLRAPNRYTAPAFMILGMAVGIAALFGFWHLLATFNILKLLGA